MVGDGSAYAERSDSELCRLASGGDVSAFEALAKRHWHRSVLVAMRTVRNMADAQDVAQEVWLELACSKDSLSKQPFGAALYVRSKSRAIDLVRKRGSRRESFGRDPGWLRDPREPADDDFDRIVRWMRDVLENDERTAEFVDDTIEIVLLSAMGYEDRESAELLNIPYDALKKRRQRALEELRENLPDWGIEL